MFGRKISKNIKYPRSFNMKPLMDTTVDVAKMKEQTKDINGLSNKVPKIKNLPD